MKSTLFTVIAFLLLFAYGCEENMPIIPKLGPKEAGERVVLIEEFSGVRCPNCPAGSEEIENLLALYPDNLVAVTIHAGSFAFPYKESKYDFKIQEGLDLQTTFGGEPLGYPSAVVNRNDFGESSLYKGKSAWGGLIINALNEEPVANIRITTNYDEPSRTVTIATTTIPTKAISGNLKMGVFLTESGMIDKQANDQEDDGITEDYEHKYVLRDYATNIAGNVISETPSVGTAIDNSFTMVLDPEWKADKCEIIVFLNGSATGRKVLNASREKFAQ